MLGNWAGSSAAAPPVENIRAVTSSAGQRGLAPHKQHDNHDDSDEDNRPNADIHDGLPFL
jgi:hypothetical protein